MTTLLDPLGVVFPLPTTQEEWDELPNVMDRGQGVVVIPDLNLTPPQLEGVLLKCQQALGHHLLTYDRWPGQSPGVDGTTHLAMLGNYKARVNDKLVQAAEPGQSIAEFKPASMKLSEWHTDGSFLERPKTFIALYAPANVNDALPEEGGETRFASTRASKEALAKYKNWTSVHSWRAFMRFLEARDPKRPKVTEEDCARKPDQTWDLIRNGHLYINPKNTCMVCNEQGQEVDNPSSLVMKLAQEEVIDSGIYWHKWRKGDLVLWDNQVLLHAATPFDSNKYERLLYRAEFGPYYLPASPDTVVWGFMEKRPPVFSVPSGSVVVVDTVSGSVKPPDTFQDIPQELYTIQDAVTERVGPHILTGPIEVKDAAPGDTLRIDILDVRMRSDWAYTIHKKSGEMRHTKLSKLAGGYAETEWGSKLDCHPFFGVLGVATFEERVSSMPPSTEYGGNLDLKLLTKGSTLYIPVHQAGALLFIGDGHARQGDGECCGTALETSLTGTFRLTVMKGQSLTATRAETVTQLISIGVEDSVDAAIKSALSHMVEWIQELVTISTIDAECLLSVAGDISVTQVVNGTTRGAHVVLLKDHLPQA